MLSIKRYLLSAVVLLLVVPIHGQIRLSQNEGFALVDGSQVATILYDDSDAKVVAKSVELFSADIKAVSGKSPVVTKKLMAKARNIIVVGTIGESRFIDQLVEDKKIDVAQINGAWERYGIFIVQNPFVGVRSALVVAGSDRRATAFGIFSISEAIGVSPWYWWADVPVKEHKRLFIDVDNYLSAEPSVKYRGIFINDEDWGLLPWAQKRFEPQAATIGPKTYAKVCELLLRLKANYLCPAMHRRSVAFNQISENKVVADQYAIVMGSVHCEPLLYNNAREWDKATMGEWNYQTNKETINGVLRRRVEENGGYENIYTLALRGLHDKAMEGSRNFEDRRRVLESALDDQRDILSGVIGKPLSEIPQAFTPYKEVMDIYAKGMKVPEEVTIIWPDDNFGYMKRLSNPAERERSGRSGVYYHISYHGKPHDYLWLCTTPPQLMYGELRKAYDTSADRIWLLNVGDIKPCEFGMDLFLRMAYDISAMSYDNVADSHARFLASMFGEKYLSDLRFVTDEYYRLAFSSKPEFMGWGYEWNTKYSKHEIVSDTDYSFDNYCEADNRLADYQRLGSISQRVYNSISGQKAKASYYQLMHYPVKGSELMNKMHLLAQKNRSYAFQGLAEANVLRQQSLDCFDSLSIITHHYNSLLGGKWEGMMSLLQGVTANYFKAPKLDSIVLPSKPMMDVRAQGENGHRGSRSFCALPTMDKFLKQSFYFDIFNRGAKPFSWSLTCPYEWISVSCSKGDIIDSERVWVSIDWSKVPQSERALAYVDVTGAGSTERVMISAFNPSKPTIADLDGLFVQNNGYISMPAAEYHRKVESEQIKMTIIENLGVENRSVMMGDPLAPEQNLYDTVPRLEYDFYTFSHGSVDVYTYMLPTFPLHPKEEFGNEYGGHDATNQELRYGVSIDDMFVSTPTISSHEYAQSWSENVLRNCSVKKTTMKISKPGLHTLKILCGDPGVIVQKIVIDMGGLKRSYTGPTSSRVVESNL